MSREEVPARTAPGSTVVLVEEEKVLLLREGEIPFRTINEFLGKE